MLFDSGCNDTDAVSWKHMKTNSDTNIGGSGLLPYLPHLISIPWRFWTLAILLHYCSGWSATHRSSFLTISFLLAADRHFVIRSARLDVVLI